VETSAQQKIIGLLGGIGSGKSSVAAEFRKLGCKVIDADDIAHKFLDDPAIKKQILEAFGDEIFDDSSQINCKKLAEITFSSKQQLQQLNNILHPVILGRCEQLLNGYKHQPEIPAIIIDMPLLVEVGWDKKCDKLIFVDCKIEKRLERVKKKGLLDEKQLKKREKFQISLDNKMQMADNVINNNSDFSELSKQVIGIFHLWHG
jgi:dephospho-CoA kinase